MGSVRKSVRQLTSAPRDLLLDIVHEADAEMAREQALRDARNLRRAERAK